MKRWFTGLFLLLAGAVHYALIFCGGWFLINVLELQDAQRSIAFGLLTLIGLGALLYPLLFVRLSLECTNVRPNL